MCDNIVHIILLILMSLINQLKSKLVSNLPERATISLVLKPLFVKEDIRALRSISGDGISVVAASLLAVVESLLPNPTFHDGPPN